MFLKLIIILTTCLFFQLDVSCNTIETRGQPISYTQQETLSFLVKESDLIAIIRIRGEIGENGIPRFEDKPKQVNAEIVSIIKGQENIKSISMLDSPKFFPPEVIKSSIVLRDGIHLVFLTREGSLYKPTTCFSILDVFRGRVYPVWKQKEDGGEITSGYPIEQVITEIESVK